MRSAPTLPPGSRQRGAVLVVALMFLTVLTLIATIAVRTGMSEERMARATRDYNVAFQAAEAALRDAKADLTGYGTRDPVIIANVDFVANCVNGLCLMAAPGTTPVWEIDANWNNAVAYAQYTGVLPLPATGPGAVSAPPRYLIEYVAAQGSQHLYRVTARGLGPTPNMTVTLQEEVLR